MPPGPFSHRWDEGLEPIGSVSGAWGGGATRHQDPNVLPGREQLETKNLP